MEWKCLELRLTAFPRNPFVEFTSGFWENVTLEKPEIQNLQPKKHILHEDGIYGENKLLLDITPGRIDLKFSADFKNTPESEELATLGDIDSNLSVFSKLADSMFKNNRFPEIKRLAFGIVLINPVESLEEGYKELKEMLQDSITINFEDTSDFLFQFNKKVHHTLDDEDLILNKLRRHSVQKWSFIQFVNDIQTNNFTNKDLFATRLELDINSAAERIKPISKESLGSLYNKLVELGNTIISGDE